MTSPSETLGVSIPLTIRGQPDVVQAEEIALELAQILGLGSGDSSKAAAAVKLMAGMLVASSGHGTMALAIVEHRGRRGLEVAAEPDKAAAPAVKAYLPPEAVGLMDELVWVSARGGVTRLVARKWRPS